MRDVSRDTFSVVKTLIHTQFTPELIAAAIFRAFQKPIWCSMAPSSHLYTRVPILEIFLLSSNDVFDGANTYAQFRYFGRSAAFSRLSYVDIFRELQARQKKKVYTPSQAALHSFCFECFTGDRHIELRSGLRRG